MTFFKRNWLLTLFVIAALGISGYFLYLSQQPPQINGAPTPSVPKTSEPPAQPKPVVGDTSQGGHWHGDEWHAEPHETSVKPPAPVQESPSGEVPGVPVITEPIDAQIIEQAAQAGDIKLFDKRTEEYHKAVKAWQDWHQKFDELNAQFLQVGDEMIDALPETKEEAKRYDNDENYKKEVARKYHEAFAKSAKIGAMLEAHEATKPPFPYIK